MGFAVAGRSLGARSDDVRTKVIRVSTPGKTRVVQGKCSQAPVVANLQAKLKARNAEIKALKASGGGGSMIVGGGGASNAQVAKLQDRVAQLQAANKKAWAAAKANKAAQREAYQRGWNGAKARFQGPNR
jgi:capsule polysaccharide export protein KpsE/RkpR